MTEGDMPIVIKKASNYESLYKSICLVISPVINFWIIYSLSKKFIEDCIITIRIKFKLISIQAILVIC
jgi:hypothetical protein